MHTPGPWKNGYDANGNSINMQRSDAPEGIVNKEWQANLRLCDAAPELLTALHTMIDAFVELNSEYIGVKGIAVYLANEAIEKATGESICPYTKS